MATRRRTRGFSLLETVVAAAVFAVIGVGFAGVSRSAGKAIETHSLKAELVQKGRRALDRCVRALRSASFATMRTTPIGFQTPQPIVDDVAMDDLEFQAMWIDPEGAGDLPVLSGVQRISTRESETDPANGIDDDHDGTIDGVDVVLEQPGMDDQILLTHVAAFELRAEGRTLTLVADVRKRDNTGEFQTERTCARVEIRND